MQGYKNVSSKSIQRLIHQDTGYKSYKALCCHVHTSFSQLVDISNANFQANLPTSTFIIIYIPTIVAGCTILMSEKASMKLCSKRVQRNLKCYKSDIAQFTNLVGYSNELSAHLIYT